MVIETNNDSKWNVKRWANHNFLIRLPRTFLHLSAQKEDRGVSIKVTLKKIEMEYGIYFISKYTTLQINTMLDWKRWTKIKKWHGRKSPKGGWGMGSKEPIQKLFLLPAVTISANWYDASWSLYRMKSRAYKVQKLKISVRKGDPWGDSEAQKSLSTSSSSLFLLCLLKTRNIIRLKYSQKNF